MLYPSGSAAKEGDSNYVRNLVGDLRSLGHERDVYVRSGSAEFGHGSLRVLEGDRIVSLRTFWRKLEQKYDALICSDA